VAGQSASPSIVKTVGFVEPSGLLAEGGPRGRREVGLVGIE